MLHWLSGLTCNDENFTTKAGVQRITAELGITLVTPDTSPRSDEVANNDRYDPGQDTGLYLNTTEAPWAVHYRMYDYLRGELPALTRSEFSVDECCATNNHSMGGHGTLVMVLRNPGRYVSVSAFAPIVNLGQAPWGKKAFTAYLGAGESTRQSWDSCALIQANQSVDIVPMLIDQGDGGPFLAGQLQPVILAETARQRAQPLTLCIQPGYDYSYYFIVSFIGDHLRFHAQHLFT